MSPIPRLQPFAGPALLSYGFRPFFLAGAIYAGLGVLIWLPLFGGELILPITFSPLDWHIHEMLYGYLPAIITGFLLTAVPNWTGRMPLQGVPLAFLVTVWLAGRIAVGVSAIIGPLAAGVIDVLFVPLVAAAMAREVIVGRNWRNVAPVFILLIFFFGNLAFHIEDYETGRAEFAARLGIAAAVALVSLIGGRIVPSFTHNWLVRENPGRLPVPFGQFDQLVMALSVLALTFWVARPAWMATAALMLIATAAQIIRMGRWAGDRTLGDRLVLILHIAYAFIPIGFAVLAAAVIFPRAVPVSAGIHAWTVGAIGTMTLAVMTRASLGHTGHPLVAGLLNQSIYGAVVIAAVLRILATVFQAATIPLLYAAGAAWIAAFWMFAAGYALLLSRPRRTAREKERAGTGKP